MRHLQLYESFGPKGITVTVYNDIDLWMEFLKMTLSREKYIGVNYEFWKGLFAPGVSIYTAKAEPNRSTWFFWDDPKFGEMEIRKIVYDTIRSGVQSDAFRLMEEDLGCSYQDLIKQAKPPGEVMIRDILENPDMLEYYSEEAPLTLESGIALAPEQIKALLKWKQIKRFI